MDFSFNLHSIQSTIPLYIESIQTCNICPHVTDTFTETGSQDV